MSSESVVGGGAVAASRPSIKTRPCRVCGDDIPQKRMEATQGRARECVTCLELLGDVPRIKRFDEAGADGEVVETVFYHNSYVEEQMERVNSLSAPDVAYEIAVGDDSFLERDEANVIASADSMADAFEEDEEEQEEVIEKEPPKEEPKVAFRPIPTPAPNMGLHGAA